jgi:protein involved in polysaccharide export with SLBB domain
LSRWLGTGVTLAGLSGLLAGTAQGQPAFDQVPPNRSVVAPAAQETNTFGQPAPMPAPRAAEDQANPLGSFSITNPKQRGEWQQRLTLGPGDVLNINLFGQATEASRAATGQAGTEVAVGPDGKVSFMQAVDVPAAGLTIDELRGKLDGELGKYYRAPRTIINPVAFRSKKYFMLGKVINRGVYVLDQPITLLEAVARAKGLETGLVDLQNTVDLADLQKSFLMRQGKRVPVDFQKLFQEGDLSQNVAIEPGDYIYIAPANLQEVYVLGEVKTPGPVLRTASTTVAGAISARGGFTDKAFKGKVLVIRGSLSKPETFVINVWGNLEGSQVGFKLQNKDIIYVAHRTFVRVEELLDLAATAFIQSAVSAWAGGNIGPIITSPLLPQVK